MSHSLTFALGVLAGGPVWVLALAIAQMVKDELRLRRLRKSGPVPVQELR